MSLTAALGASLGELANDDANQALIALAYQYAGVLDEAEQMAADFAEIDLSTIDVSSRTWKRIEALEAKVRAETVAAEIGPKLLAALVQLGLTPAARGKGVTGESGDAAERELAALRDGAPGRLRVV